MPSSDVEICNMALANIGARSTIASLTEQSTEARQCNIIYGPARDYILRKHPWKFATKVVALSDIGSPPPDWSYRYQYPSDCLNAREILTGDRSVSAPVPFEIVAGDTLNDKAILSDKDQAYLRYTARVTNAAIFDASFVELFSWYMAIKLAMPLTGKKSIRDDALFGYRLVLGDAEATDLNEGEHDPHRESDFITSRY